MPLRFRSIVPYTLPGILVLIGWWWHVSRKKNLLPNPDVPKGAAVTADVRTASAEGSNGLVEKATASTANASESPAHRPTELTRPKNTRHKDVSPIQEQDLQTAALGLDLEEAEANVDRALPSFGEAEELQMLIGGHAEPQRNSGPPSESGPVQVTPQEHHTILSESTKVPSPVPVGVRLSEGQRPDPEGEVATNHRRAQRQEESSSCGPPPLKTPEEIQVGSSSLVTPPPALDEHQHTSPNTHVLTSTPQDSKRRCAAPSCPQLSPPQQCQLHLEGVAAQLITDVISAATQEVLGVTTGQSVDGDAPSVTNGTRPHLGQGGGQPHTVSAAVDYECTDGLQKDNQGVSNGCPPASVWEPLTDSYSLRQSGGVDTGPWPPLLQQALHSPRAALAEDSACSTAHSDDGHSSEDLHNGLLLHQSDDVIQVSHLSATDALQSGCLAETVAEAAISVTSEEDCADVDCDLKRLDPVELRNGAKGTSEVETDQSAGSDVNSMDSVDSGCTISVGGDAQSNHAPPSSDLIVWEIEVPKHLVGRLIGKQGRYVSLLKQSSGAKIYIFTLPYTQEFQICHIEGSQQQVDKALALIGKKFKDLDLTNLYAPPPPPLTLPSLPMTSWLLLPSGVTVEVIVVNIVSAGHVFVQQHTHPTYHALRSLDQQMFLCYSQLGTPTLPSPAEVGVICAAPAVEGAWWRAQVINFYKESEEVEIRYVDYGGYDRVKIDSLRQIRSDFVTLPFQGAEVLLDNLAPLPGEDRFSAEATAALEEMSRGVALLAQVTNYDNNTGLPLVHLWNMVGDEVVSINRVLSERGLALWVEGL